MYCKKCGRELSDGAKVCPECGEIVYSQKATIESGVVSTKDWFVTMLVACIPLVGIVMMFVWAFGNTKPSKKNWARAALIWCAVAVLMIIFFGASIAATLTSLLS